MKLLQLTTPIATLLICVPAFGAQRVSEQTLAELEAQCDSGSADSCFKVLVLLSSAAIKDQAAAARSFNAGIRACDLNHGHACKFLADAYSNGLGVPIDMKKGAEYYRRACELDFASGCIGLGIRHLHGNAPADLRGSLAVIAFEKACQLGESFGCKKVEDITGRGSMRPRRMPSSEALVSIEMPGNPKQTTTAADTAAGKPANSKYEYFDGDSYFIFQLTQIPSSPANRIEPETVLSNVRSAFAANSFKRVSVDKPVEILNANGNAVSAHELQGPGALRGFLRITHFVYANCSVSVMVISESRKFGLDSYRRLVRSLKLRRVPLDANTCW